VLTFANGIRAGFRLVSSQFRLFCLVIAEIIQGVAPVDDFSNQDGSVSPLARGLL
jgi:hypothetical protein